MYIRRCVCLNRRDWPFLSLHDLEHAGHFNLMTRLNFSQSWKSGGFLPSNVAADDVGVAVVLHVSGARSPRTAHNLVLIEFEVSLRGSIHGVNGSPAVQFVATAAPGVDNLSSSVFSSSWSYLSDSPIDVPDELQLCI